MALLRKPRPGRPSALLSACAAWATLQLCACATAPPVKEASSQQLANLDALERARAQLVDQVDGWMRRLIAEQRDAFVAQRLGDQVEKLAARFDGTRPADALPRDLIAAGAELADGRHHLLVEWDYWMRDLQGESFAARKESLLKKVAAYREEEKQLEAQASPDAPQALRLKLLRRTLEVTQARIDEGSLDAFASHLDTALALEKQRQELQRELDVLRVQLAVMRAVHGVVDQYVQIDSTIDGTAIGQAMAAGAAVDPAKVSLIRAILPGGGK